MIRVVYDEAGYIEKVHPKPTEECNLDDAVRVETRSFAEVLLLVANEFAIGEEEHLSMEDIEDILCDHCGEGLDD